MNNEIIYTDEDEIIYKEDRRYLLMTQIYTATLIHNSRSALSTRKVYQNAKKLADDFLRYYEAENKS